MKILLFSLTILFTSTAMALFSRDNTPQVPYKVLRKDANIEVRAYEPVLLASVEKQGHMMDVGSSGFRDLASFIFGGNEASTKIAMTAPVNFVETDSGKTRMSFSMPAGFNLKNLPRPASKQIQIHELPAQQMAVLQFGGFAGNRSIEAKALELRNWLRKEGIAWNEPVIFMAYNSPWTLIGRRNEVAFSLKEQNPAAQN
jgi:hypothetical protein